MRTLLCGFLLATIVPDEPPAAKYWLEIQVIEYADAREKRISGTSGFERPKDAKVIATSFHPLVIGQPVVQRKDAGSLLRSRVAFTRYGVESHLLEITIEHVSGAGRDAFTHEATATLDLEPAGSLSFGSIRAGERRQRAFVAILRRIK